MDPLIDLVDLHARREISRWEREDWRSRSVCWIGDQLRAVDLRADTIVFAADYPELVDRLELGARS